VGAIVYCGHSARAETWQELMWLSDSLGQANNFDSAAVIGQKALQLVRTEHGDSEIGTGLILISVAHWFELSGKYDKAELMNHEALKIAEKAYGTDDPDVANIVIVLARICNSQGRYFEAESLYQRALAIYEKGYNPVDNHISLALSYLGNFYKNLGRYSEAEPLLRRALEINEKILGLDNLDLARSINDLANLLETPRQSLEAESLYRRTLEIYLKKLGPGHPFLAAPLNGLAGIYKSQGRYIEAESLYWKAVKIYEKAPGPDSFEMASILFNLGDLYKIQGRYREAIDLQQRVLEIWQKARGSEHPDVAVSLYELARLYLVQGRYNEAESLSIQALKISEKAYGPENRFVSASLDCLACIYDSEGRFIEAEPLHLRALEINEKILNKDDPDLGASMNNLANFYIAQARYSEAEPLLRRALEIAQKILGPDDPDVATSLNNLALLYFNQGRYIEALPKFQRALEIDEIVLGPEHFKLANVLINLARTYNEQGFYPESESLYWRAIGIYENTFGPNHLYVANALNNLACLYQDQERYSEAESSYQRALEIKEQVLGPDHPEVAISLNNLGYLYITQNRYSKAEPLYRKALEINKNVYGLQHPIVANSLNNLATMYHAQWRYAEADSLYNLALEIALKDFARNAATLNERDAMKYAEELPVNRDLLLSCRYFSKVGGTDEIAKAIIYSKGLVTEEIVKTRRAIYECGDSTVLRLTEMFNHIQDEQSMLYADSSEHNINLLRVKEDSLSHVGDSLESELALWSSAYNGLHEGTNMGVDKIKHLLPSHSFLADYLKWTFYSFNLNHDWGSASHYLVLVITSKGESHIIDLGDAGAIDSLVDEYRYHMLNMARRWESGNEPSWHDLIAYRRIAQQLYGLLWEPIEDYIKGSEMALISPDGPLNLLSFSGLMPDSDRYLIEDYQIHYLSAGRDLVRLNLRDSLGTGLLAMGAPDYDATVRVRLTALGRAVKYIDTTTVEGILASAERGSIRSNCDALSDKVYAYPGMRDEIKKVVDIWHTKTGEDVPAYLGVDASEERFKMEAKGKQVLHLATHGFYIGAKCEKPTKSSIRNVFDLLNLKTINYGENPLLHSGLLMAGSNLHGQDDNIKGSEDGYLTALDISGLDLRGTELVVLSACETGLGDIKEGEGVYGLRRAFQIAGARTVVCSLWAVSDEMANRMMGNIYSGSMISLPERLRNMELAEIRKLRQEGKPDHPFIWGPFVAEGDWR
jgi:tetratricopeptide (TPR) repeat protein/CHAT domain-containing protein